jgi:hypothetical protein
MAMENEKDLVARLRWLSTNVHSDSAVVPTLQRALTDAADEIARLTTDLKNAVWSDSEELKMVTEQNNLLRVALWELHTHSTSNTFNQLDLMRRVISDALALGNT